MPNIMTNPKLSTDLKETLEKVSTQTFLKAARQFVELVESKQIDKERFYNLSHTCLVDLYSAGHKLESINLKYSSIESIFEEFENEFFQLINIH